MNTTNLDALNIARAAYRELPTVDFYDTHDDGSIKITRTDGETLTYRINTAGYTIALYSTEGEAYKIDNATGISNLRAEISEWANADTTNAN